MKNKLAENMLRFGTKNLTESQLENIQETELNEAFDSSWADKNIAPILQKAFDSNTPANKIPAFQAGPFIIQVTGDGGDDDPIYRGNVYGFGIDVNGLIGMTDKGGDPTANFLWRVRDGVIQFDPRLDRIDRTMQGMNTAYSQKVPSYLKNQVLNAFKVYYNGLNDRLKQKVKNGLAAFKANPKGLTGNALAMQLAFADTTQVPG